jgi:large subunit ribosomal protein L6
MSRIGNLPISIPQGVTVSFENSCVTVKGPKGELKQEMNPNISVKVEDDKVLVVRPDDTKENKAMHGLYRSLIYNMVFGVSEGYSVELELVGVGYRAKTTGQMLELSLGYSHDIYFELPSEIKVEAKQEKRGNPIVVLNSCDKQLIGHIAAKIRSFRKPEPYKGKGVRYKGEQIRRKAGKTAAK